MKVKLGMVTVRLPEHFVDLRLVVPDKRTRAQVNVRIEEKANEIGVRARRDPRIGKDANRVDLGQSHAEWRRLLLNTEELVAAMCLGNWYGRYIETEEAGGKRERKLQLHQTSGGFQPQGQGVLKAHELDELMEVLEMSQATIRNLWVNPDPEGGKWANLVIGPAGDARDRYAPLSFSHDGDEVVIEIPD